MKQYLFVLLLFILGGCAHTTTPVIDSYESCINAGGMMLKMYPPACVHGGQTYRKVLQR
jgi:hypothetical protein